MPCASPVLVKRRFTPAKPASARRMVSSGRPISCATATAASAFCTLCWPNIGRGTTTQVRASWVADHRQAPIGDGARLVGGAVRDLHVEVGAGAVEPQVDRPHVGVDPKPVG